MEGKKSVFIAVLVAVVILALIIVLYPAGDSSVGVLSIESDKENYSLLEPINLTVTLSNEGSEPITISDFDIRYNVFIYIRGDDGRLARNGFGAINVPSNLTIEPGTSYNKEIEINQYPDIYIYLNVTDYEFTFLFEPGNYTIYASYVDRTVSEAENIIELYQSNEIHIRIV